MQCICFLFIFILLGIQCDEKEFVKSLILLNCSYCGGDANIGIDRIDSSVPYQLGNVVPCCTICNLMKSVDSCQQFLDKCKQITKTQEEHGFRRDVVDNCAYCDSDITKKVSVDRIDSSIIGYEDKSNLVNCCAMCNYMKRHHDLEVFFQHTSMIAQYDHQIQSSVEEVLDMHQVLKTVASTSLALVKSNRRKVLRITDFEVSENASKIVVMFKGKTCKSGIYHSTGTNYSCLDQETKADPMKFDVISLLKSGRKASPCKICRKIVLTEELDLINDPVRAKIVANYGLNLAKKQRMSADEISGIDDSEVSLSPLLCGTVYVEEDKSSRFFYHEEKCILQMVHATTKLSDPPSGMMACSSCFNINKRDFTDDYKEVLERAKRSRRNRSNRISRKKKKSVSSEPVITGNVYIEEDVVFRIFYHKKDCASPRVKASLAVPEAPMGTFPCSRCFKVAKKDFSEDYKQALLKATRMRKNRAVKKRKLDSKKDGGNDKKRLKTNV
jgi:hypothetical protein